MTALRTLTIGFVALVLATPAFGQEVTPPTTAIVIPASQPGEVDEKKEKEADEQIGFSLPNSDKLRVRLSTMASYYRDDAQRALGFEKQARVGYVIVEMWGKLNNQVSYRIAINPVNEGEPKPACGEEDFFYPNDPNFLGTMGPNVSCDPEGNRRVDMYKYLSLDPMNQQGAIREAYINFALMKNLKMGFGRFILPLGFGWEEAGSFTSKDSTRIQRINAESNFGIMFNWSTSTEGRKKPMFSAHASGFLGDGNRNKEVVPFYFERSDLDSNSALTALVSATFSPTDSIDIRVANKVGYTGSKVERLPNYWASKRHDGAFIVSASYAPVKFLRAFGEYANYTWGITQSSAEMLGYDEEHQKPIKKTGYYAGVEGRLPITRSVTVGASYTREEISRDDSLVKYLAHHDLLGVEMGKKDRGNIVRFFVEVPNVTFGIFRNDDSTPYPWLSGIAPIAGERAFQGSTSKWGFVIRATVQ